MTDTYWEYYAEVEARNGPTASGLREIDKTLTHVRTIASNAPTVRDNLHHTAIDRPGTHSVVVQASRCATLSATLSTWGDALEFPRYYGQNLDAFDECLNDLLNLDATGFLGGAFRDRIGRPADTLLIVVNEADDLLVDAPPGVFRRFLDVIEYAASITPQPGSPSRTASLWLVLLSADDEVLRRRLG